MSNRDLASKSATPALGLVACTALVVGNMIGSGVFLLPASLAPFGPLAMVGWIVTSMGALVLATIFGRLSKIVTKPGGPYAYSQEAFGDFAGFLIAWGYWIALWTGNAGVAVALVGYLGFLVPAIGESETYSIAAALIAIWTLTAINIRGVAEAGFVQIVTTFLKLVPLIMVGVLGLFWVQMDNIGPMNPSGMPAFTAVSAAGALTLWAYLGLESATVPSGDVVDPAKTIPRATILGVIIAACVYILVTFVCMGVMPPDQLGASAAPVADVAKVMFGTVGGLIVAVGAVISTFGTLNGFTLLTGQVPYGAALDKVFPQSLGKVSRYGTPANAIVVSNTLASLLIVLNFSQGLVSAFNFIVLLAVTASLLPYAFCAVAEVMIRLRGGHVMRGGELAKATILGLLGFVYSMWALVGAGGDAVMLGIVLVLAGIPIHVWVRWKQAKDAETEAEAEAA
ncbi:Arginine/agmatine antiporter [Shimia sp. SK013]|uniref:amino acid permease n=1 Tax=Shimia sp. SK013 TaxID=1389006 RepID=UPI0006B4FDF5|nr:amino acid permease [Shimia sp. SK013]KPA22364.1 Arginine/agmatine antiporter [Shimia sp. SK013]